ncbi:MAG TPA: DNA primase [Candidatus Acidoferrales bacterium]|nr:DNA primase [Candidatus Acidoferrales bacterium]
MAEAGSFAERVKQQADIVRVVGEYVRLKKSGQNFTGLCPFHSEKTPSFAVHPVKQIYHCFGCGVGGDVFSFVMEMEKCPFPEAVRVVAEKCGIPIPRPRERSPEERRENQQRTALVEMHREAAAFFAKQLEGTLEGKAARAYLEDRGLDAEAIARFGLGFAPSGGEILFRHLKQKYPDKLIEVSGLASRDPSGRLFDRFRRRIMFPIANESGKIIAFGGRALGDDMPKYLNSPETPVYSKSNVLYHLDRAKEGMRRQDSAILVEGYMDTIGVARAGISNVVASCGTSLAESQVKLLARFTRRIIVNYDPDAAGQAAAERSIGLLLEQGFDVRVLALPGKADPDKFIREQGAEAYRKLVEFAPEYVDYLIGRARLMDLSTGEGKLRAVNFLMPYVQRIPNRLLRSEWATRIAQQLRVEEPVLRESLRKAAAERRSEVKTQPELVGRGAKQAERRLIQMLTEAEGFRERLARELRDGVLYQGLETERIFAALVEVCAQGTAPDASALANALPESDRRLWFEIIFEAGARQTWAEAESCLAILREWRAKAQRDAVQRDIEAHAVAGAASADGRVSADLLRPMAQKEELHRKAHAEMTALKQELEKKRSEGPPDDDVSRQIREMIENSLRRLRGPEK